MNGFTVKSISEEGTYYLVRDWRKNKAIWIKEEKLKQEHLYKSANTSIRALEKLLNAMEEYATDKFNIVCITDGNITDCEKLSVKNHSDSEWKNDYKVTICS